MDREKCSQKALNSLRLLFKSCDDVIQHGEQRSVLVHQVRLQVLGQVVTAREAFGAVRAREALLTGVRARAGASGARPSACASSCRRTDAHLRATSGAPSGATSCRTPSRSPACGTRAAFSSPARRCSFGSWGTCTSGICETWSATGWRFESGTGRAQGDPEPTRGGSQIDVLRSDWQSTIGPKVHCAWARKTWEE